METGTKMTSDDLIQDLGGCGRFQILFSILPYLVQIPSAFSTLFMTFGSYNPGWRCQEFKTKNDSFYMHTKLDLERQKLIEANLTQSVEDLGYITDSCRGFEWCKNLEFDPRASTVVTQWGLGCDREWKISLIITLQMCGGMVAGLLIGSFGDKFGRKPTLYSLLLTHIGLNVACMYSVNVETFIALRFFIGANDVLLHRLPLAYILEVVPTKWRVIVGGVPVWTVGGILFAVSAMLTQDWFQMSLIIALLSLACFLPVFWVPESFRWLAVKGKTESLLESGEKIAVMNKTKLDHAQCRSLIKDEESEGDGVKTKTSGFVDLFRKGHASYALILGFSIMCADMLYFASHFGASFLRGNVYINLILLSCLELPANLIAMFLPNLIGRKFTITIAMMFQAFCLFGAVAIELILGKDPDDYSIVVLVMIGKVGTCVGGIVLNVFILEIYPTSIRSTASGYSGVMGMVGAMLAPFVVARDRSEVYICYLIMSVVATICSCMVLMVPETKGKPLPDTWGELKGMEDEEEEEEDDSTEVEKDEVVDFREKCFVKLNEAEETRI